MLDFFGVPTENRGAGDIDMARNLASQWAKHDVAMRDDGSGAASTRAGLMTPRRAMMYWHASRKELPDLGNLALLRLARPNGNAAPERFMSLIKDMDSDKAQSMKKGTLYNVSMIRGNAPLVRVLLGCEAERIKGRTEKKRGPAAAAATAAAKLSTAARLDAALNYAAEASLPKWAQEEELELLEVENEELLAEGEGGGGGAAKGRRGGRDMEDEEEEEEEEVEEEEEEKEREEEEEEEEGGAAHRGGGGRGAAGRRRGEDAHPANPFPFGRPFAHTDVFGRNIFGYELG